MAELVGAVGAHVARTGPGRDVQHVLRVVAHGRHPLHLHERIGRVRVVDADGYSRITRQCTAFRRFTAGVEHQLAGLDDEPHRRDQRPAVGGDIAEHSGAGARRQERDNRFGKFGHAPHLVLKPGQVVVGDVVDEDLQVVLRGAQRVFNGGEPGGVMADGIFRGHADAAVQLDRLLRDVSGGPADLQLGPRRDHRVEVAVGD